jgi:Putative prokaryotic signal transducing protein
VAVRIHQANDQTSAELMAGRLRAEGIPAQIIQADAGAPYGGFGMSSAFDILVPESLAAKARAILAKGEPGDARGRRR